MIEALVEMSKDPILDIQKNLFTYRSKADYDAFFSNWGLTPVAKKDVLKFAQAAISKSPQEKLKAMAREMFARNLDNIGDELPRAAQERERTELRKALDEQTERRRQRRQNQWREGPLQNSKVLAGRVE